MAEAHTGEHPAHEHPGQAHTHDSAPRRSFGDTLRSMLRALRHRNFKLFFSGQLISVMGTWMQSIAQDWLVYRLTGSATLMGTVAFVSQIPIFLLSPATGIVVDRHNRHRIIIATQSASMVLALALAALTLTGHIRVWEIMVLASLLGVVNAVDIPARQSFLIEMVGREDLLNAIGLNSAMFNGARVVGPAIAGILVAAIGEGWCFFANGVSYIAVIAGLLMMHVTRKKAPPPSGSHLENILEGLRFARQTAPVRALLLLIGVTSLAATPYAVLMPIFANQVLHGGPSLMGWLMGITGVGALIGALTVASKPGVQGLGRWIWMGGTGFGGSLVVFSASRHVWLSSAALALAGFSIMLMASSVNTLLQAMVPDQLRGPGDGALLDDVHWHDADRSAAGRRRGRQNRRSVDGRARRSPVRGGGAVVCPPFAEHSGRGAATAAGTGHDPGRSGERGGAASALRPRQASYG